MSALLGKPCITIKCHWCGSTSLTDLKRDINGRFPSNWADILGFSLHVSSCPWQVSLNGCDRVLDNIKFAYKTLLFPPPPAPTIFESSKQIKKRIISYCASLNIYKTLWEKAATRGEASTDCSSGIYKMTRKKGITNVHQNKCSNGRTEVLLPAILGNYNRPTGRAD